MRRSRRAICFAVLSLPQTGRSGARPAFRRDPVGGREALPAKLQPEIHDKLAKNVLERLVQDLLRNPPKNERQLRSLRACR